MGNVGQNSNAYTGGSAFCGGAFDINAPHNLDTVAGTHMAIWGNYMMNNVGQPMSNRQEFDKKTRVEITKRAGSRCEFVSDSEALGFVGGVRCGATKGLEVHHNTKMDALKSDADKAKVKLTADDGLLLCKDHHKEETAIQRALARSSLRKPRGD